MDPLIFEQQAVGQLAAKLAEGLESTGLNEADVIIWGVDLSNLSPDLSRQQESVLLKFLRARKFDVEKAYDMLIECLKWRRDFDIKGLMKERFPPELTSLGCVYGRDKTGGPVTYNTYGNMDVDKVFGIPGGVGKFIRWRVQLMERAIARLDFGGSRADKIMQVHDYNGTNMFAIDGRIKEASKHIIKLFQNNYPELLSAKLFLHVPRVLEFAFALFSAFSDVDTRKKFVMVSSPNTRPTLLRYINADQLPTIYGGLGDAKSRTEVYRAAVPAGKQHTHTVADLPRGSTAHWDFISERGSATVAVEAGGEQVYRDKAVEGHDSYTAAAKDGIPLRLIVDNTKAWMYESAVHYRVWVTHPHK